MGFLDRLVGNKPEKTEKQIQAEQKSRAAEIRGKTENLLTAMKKINLYDPTGRISRDETEKYKMVLQNLADRLDRAPVSLLDTRKMDEQMIWLVEHLEEAFKNGSPDTAQRIQTALIYGVGKGHEQIPSSDGKKIPDILRDRENRLGQYITIVEYSQKIDERRRSIEIQQKKYDQASGQFKESYARVKQEMKENPHLVEMIDQYGEKVKDINIDAFHLAVKYREVAKIYKDMEMLKGQMALNETTINSCSQIIRSEENALTELATAVTQEMQDQVIRHEAEFRNRLVELQQQITQLDELSERFEDTIKEVFASPVMGDYIVKSAIEFENMEKAIEKEKAGKARGRELQLQQKLEEEAENQEQGLLNN